MTPPMPPLPGGGTWCTGCAYHQDARPKLVDVCCCGGGAAVGYFRAGFCVTGVDIDPQPRFPFRFVRADAVAYLEAHAHEYAAGAGSPPCQHWSPLNAYNHKTCPQLIDPVRERFEAAGLPYVIENVEAAAAELRDPDHPVRLDVPRAPGRSAPAVRGRRVHPRPFVCRRRGVIGDPR